MRTLTITLLFSSAVAAAEPVKNELPKDWHGTWKGTLTLPGEDGKPAELPMILIIEPLKDSPRIRFQITYGEGKKASVRKYELVPGADSGRFQIDEKNGILLDARLVKNVIFAQFEVQESFLCARYELDGTTLKYEVTSAGKPTETGGSKGMPKVKSFTVTSVQSAILKK